MSQLYLVTGASSGIGLAICRQLLRGGHRVVGIARTEKISVAECLDEFPSTFNFISRDLSVDIDDLSRLPIKLAKQYGKFSGFVHAAGLFYMLPNRFNSLEKMLESFNLNLFSSLALARGISDKRVCSESGVSIVFISSIAANAGVKGTVNYSASKASLIGAVKSLSKELADQNIRVNTVSPGLIRTDMTENQHGEDFFQRMEQLYPLGLGEPEDVAYAVEFLLSNKSKWITGTDLVVDGGITLGTNE